MCNGKLLRKETDKCILRKLIKIDKKSNFEFWYFMYGFQIGSLELIINGSNLLWSLSGKQQNKWLLAKVELPSGEYVVMIRILYSILIILFVLIIQYKIEFKANRSIEGRLSSDIALDDIMIEGETCIYIKH